MSNSVLIAAKGWWRSACFAVICVLLATPKNLLIAATSSKPIWTVDLKKYGYRGRRLGVVNDPGSLAEMAFSRGSVFVLFDEKADEVPQKGTDRKTWLGWRMVGLFFDAKTGDLLAKRSWIADLSGDINVFPVVNGNFLWLMRRFPRPLHIPSSPEDLEELDRPRPAALLLLTPVGAELSRIELPVRGASKNEYWEAYVSSSGRSLLAVHVFRADSCDFLLFDTDTLKQRASWKEEGTANCAVTDISDDQVLLYGGKDRALVGPFGGSFESISLFSGHSRMLGNDLIITFGIPLWGTAWITKLDGRQITTLHFNVHDSGLRGVRPGVAPPFLSGDGGRFGTIADQVVGSIWWRRGERTIYVWQELGGRPVFVTQLKDSNDRAIAALSYDGSRLAVLNSRKVSMYELPSP